MDKGREGGRERKRMDKPIKSYTGPRVHFPLIVFVPLTVLGTHTHMHNSQSQVCNSYYSISHFHLLHTHTHTTQILNVVEKRLIEMHVIRSRSLHQDLSRRPRLHIYRYLQKHILT